jgi:hypothetical protein
MVYQRDFGKLLFAKIEEAAAIALKNEAAGQVETNGACVLLEHPYPYGGKPPQLKCSESFSHQCLANAISP